MNFKIVFLTTCVYSTAFSMNYDPVSNSKLMNLQTMAFRFKELLGIIDQRVQAAVNLEAEIVLLAAQLKAQDLTLADLKRYGEISSTLKSLNQHLQPYKESMRSRGRWFGCICFCRSRKR
jgi:hypothetical protein